ncbi:hypothetical protein ANO14919_125800 [Xylariales sp. No.14919]|nr:hypothetical protein ANO14919_125800 [Xylariales sp. No.14919]
MPNRIANVMKLSNACHGVDDALMLEGTVFRDAAGFYDYAGRVNEEIQRQKQRRSQARSIAEYFPKKLQQQHNDTRTRPGL